MNRQQLFEQIKAKRSFLCVGLDTDVNKVPTHMQETHASPMLEFNKAIIDATAEYVVAYKPNLAFYEAYGEWGMQVLEDTCIHIKEKYPDVFLILDAKRGDIGNTSAMYAEAFFGGNTVSDAVTLSPYMGRDTVDPFLKYKDKWAIILALTSNKSADDFETLELADGKGPLWKEVLRKAKTWGCEPHGQSSDGETADNLDKIMFVVGATRAEVFKEVREIVPDHFLLVPGVGAQGGSLAEVAEHGLNDRCGLLVNSSRGIIYAADQPGYADDPRRAEPDFFATAAAAEAKKMADEMALILEQHSLL